MYRGIVEQLVLWKNKIDRKPILLTGAPGVGKTTAAMQFASQHYKKKIVFQVDNKQGGFSFYESLSRKKFDEAIHNYTGVMEQKEDILLIFDNVNQESYGENSVEDVLRFIVAYLRDYDICVITSFEEKQVFTKALLEQMDVHRMYPVSLWEFLIINDDEKLYQSVKRQMECSLSEEKLEKLWKYLRVYTITGGMPYVLNTYMETRSLEKVLEARGQVYQDTLRFIKENAPADLKTQVLEVFEGLGKQLNRQRKEFRYRDFGLFVNKAIYEQAIEWLLKYQLVLKVEHMEKDVNKGFKLYYPDVTLMSHAYGIQFADLLEADNPYPMFYGAVVEEMVLLQLLSSGKNVEISYWTGKEKGEVEFISKENGEAVPVIMGFGKIYGKAYKEYCKKYKPELMIRVTGKELEVDEAEIQIPLFSVWNL